RVFEIHHLPETENLLGGKEDELGGKNGAQAAGDPGSTAQRTTPNHSDASRAKLTVVLDDVADVGQFVEIEIVVADEDDVESARDAIRSLANRLDLGPAEPRSYLTMLIFS
ncbi:MAG: hypothetical protein AAF989_11175, partial [Planctomycetota bacterium]